MKIDQSRPIMAHYVLKTAPALLLTMIVTLSGCATMEPQPVPAEAEPVAAGDALLNQQPGITPGLSAAAFPAPALIGPTGAAEPASAEPTLYRGTGQMVNMPKAGKPVRFYGEAVSLNFEQAPLVEVVHAVMGDILELDYILEHPIGGEVTLRTRTPVPRDQLLDILESLLKANNALMIRDSEGRYFVSGSGQMSRLIPSVASSTAGVSGYNTLIIPLEHIGAKSMADILAPLAEESAFVRVDAVRNMLMLAGTRAQLQGWQEIIETFDVDMLEGMSVGIFPIENASIVDIETALSDLLGKSGGTGEEMTDGLAGIGSMVRIIPVERLSSIMVVTPKAQYLDRLGLWIERLDREPDANFERRLYVYAVQNSSAVQLAALLNSVYTGTGGTGSSRSGVAPGLTPEKVSGGGSKNKKKRSNAQSTANYDLDGIRVVADEDNNALLIYATGKEYRKIKPALAQLDIAATQVIIEASIIEVTLTDELKFGLEWSFNGGLGGGYEGIGNIGTLPTTIASMASGLSYSVVNGAGQIKAVLSALASKDLLNVISSPSVMVLDNQTASIRVGDQVPIREGSTINDSGVEKFSISYRDTGVSLSVTPSVNAGGMVTMDIEQTVTDVGPIDTLGTGDRTFLEREIISRVAVRSSEAVVLGGLIRENKSSGSSGVPFLHELPLIGGLFGTKAVSGTRTELLVVITPRVIYSESVLREVSLEMRAQMRGLDLLDVSNISSFLGKNIERIETEQEKEDP
jgi:general secretion pathway protein D